MDSKMIGTINDDNTVDWPKTDVLGGNFSIPATRHALTPTTFVVLPTGFNQWERLEEMKASMGKSAPMKVKVEAKGEG